MAFYYISGNYWKSIKNFFHLTQRLESVQYNAALAITGCFSRASREKLYAELGIESLADRRQCRKLCVYYKIVEGTAPSYLVEYLPR